MLENVLNGRLHDEHYKTSPTCLMLGRSGLSWQGCVGRYGGDGDFCEYYLGSTMETRREGWQLWRIPRWRGEWEAAATMPRIFLFFSPLPSQQQFVVLSLAATADTDRTQMPKLNPRMVNYQSIFNYKYIICTCMISLVWLQCGAGCLLGCNTKVRR